MLCNKCCWHCCEANWNVANGMISTAADVCAHSEFNLTLFNDNERSLCVQQQQQYWLKSIKETTNFSLVYVNASVQTVLGHIIVIIIIFLWGHSHKHSDTVACRIRVRQTNKRRRAHNAHWNMSEQMSEWNEHRIRWAQRAETVLVDMVDGKRAQGDDIGNSNSNNHSNNNKRWIAFTKLGNGYEWLMVADYGASRWVE